MESHTFSLAKMNKLTKALEDMKASGSEDPDLPKSSGTSAGRELFSSTPSGILEDTNLDTDSDGNASDGACESSDTEDEADKLAPPKALDMLADKVATKIRINRDIDRCMMESEGFTLSRARAATLNDITLETLNNWFAIIERETGLRMEIEWKREDHNFVGVFNWETVSKVPKYGSEDLASRRKYRGPEKLHIDLKKDITTKLVQNAWSIGPDGQVKPVDAESIGIILTEIRDQIPEELPKLLNIPDVKAAKIGHLEELKPKPSAPEMVEVFSSKDPIPSPSSGGTSSETSEATTELWNVLTGATQQAIVIPKEGGGTFRFPLSSLNVTGQEISQCEDKGLDLLGSCKRILSLRGKLKMVGARGKLSQMTIE